MHLLPARRKPLLIAAALVTGALTFGMTSVLAATPTPPIKVVQNYSETPVAAGGVSCNSGGTPNENHWYRRFDLAGQHAAAQGFTVSQVVVGVEIASSADSTIPGNVAVWAIDHTDPLILANLEPLATAPVNYDTVADLALLTVPLTAVVPAGKDLVLEAAVQPGTSGELFFVGANAQAELAQDYIRAPGCGVTEITSWAGVGFPNNNHIIFARGKATDCLTAETAVTAAEAALAKAQAAIAPAQAKAAKAKSKANKAKKALKKAKKAYASAVKTFGANSAQADAAKKVKAKKAKKAKKTKKALKAANAALAAAQSALTTAQATLTAKQAIVVVECAQPALPALAKPAPSAGAVGSSQSQSFSTAGR